MSEYEAIRCLWAIAGMNCVGILFGVVGALKDKKGIARLGQCLGVIGLALTAVIAACVLKR